ncbi:MAG: FAD-dependent oxidoreductase, partial [Solirubrobacterales bacterium]|nr:FAD-dependent oxidoreductase [Solirubrobacterales bacterium]
MSETKKPRIVVVGAGFAGFHCARWLDRRVGPKAELILVNPVDHMVYSALLADVLGAVLDPGSLATPLAASLPSTRVVVGSITAVDTTSQSCTVLRIDGRHERLAWDRLVLNPGSVTRTLGIRGVLEYAHGFKTLAETIYLREQILRQLQLASTATEENTRTGHGSFVVVGGGFTGLELAGEGLRLSRAALRQHPTLEPGTVRWTVVEAGSSVLRQFPDRLARRALERMRRGGVDVRLGTGVAEIAADHVRLASGETLPTQTVIWTAGVTPAPIVSQLGLPVERGRLVVGDNLQAREHHYIYALGDAAAVPDLTHPGEVAAQTAQQAQRQGVTAARNVAASLGHGKARAYKHHDLGFAVDLGGRNAVATPLGIPLSGLLAKLAGRAYHIKALPSGRVRVLSGWIDTLISRRQIAELGLVNKRDATIQAEATG